MSSYRSVLVAVLAALSAVACDALTPSWSSHKLAVESTTCAEACSDIGQACMENQCDGGTIAVDSDADGVDDAIVPAGCEEPIVEVVSPEDYVACCCTAGVS